MAQRRFLAFRFAFLPGEMLEPLFHGENAQSFTACPLKHVAENFARADFG